jgi:hypothetical protein
MTLLSQIYPSNISCENRGELNIIKSIFDGIFEQPKQSEQMDHSGQMEQSGQSEHSGQMEQSGQSEHSGQMEQSDQSDHLGQMEQSGQSDHLGQMEQSGQSDHLGQMEQSDHSGQMEQSEHLEQSDQSTCIDYKVIIVVSMLLFGASFTTPLLQSVFSETKSYMIALLQLVLWTLLFWIITRILKY